MADEAEKDVRETRIAQFLYEAGTLRRVPRMHRQTLHLADDSDSIASHTFRVALAGWHLAKLEGADPYTVVMMCLLHDFGEVRSGDHNWLHKRYVSVADEEIERDQLGDLPFGELRSFSAQYRLRDSLEARVAKDADRLDQLLLLREYELVGNREAAAWLRGKELDQPYAKLDEMETESGRALGRAIYDEPPARWWEGVWTKENRTD